MNVWVSLDINKNKLYKIMGKMISLNVLFSN